MGAKELKLRGSLTSARVNDLHDPAGGIVIHIEAGMNSLSVTLDRNQQHLLLLYLKERLK
jgi:ammonia channel protein AmtB